MYWAHHNQRIAEVRLASPSALFGAGSTMQSRCPVGQEFIQRTDGMTSFSVRYLLYSHDVWKWDVRTRKDKNEVNPFGREIVKLFLKHFWLKVKCPNTFETHRNSLLSLYFLRFLSVSSLNELTASVCEQILHCFWKNKPFQWGSHLCPQVSGPTKEMPPGIQKWVLLWQITWRDDNHWVEIIWLKNITVKTFGRNTWLNFKEIAWTLECNIPTLLKSERSNLGLCPGLCAKKQLLKKGPSFQTLVLNEGKTFLKAQRNLSQEYYQRFQIILEDSFSPVFWKLLSLEVERFGCWQLVYNTLLCKYLFHRCLTVYLILLLLNS